MRKTKIAGVIAAAAFSCALFCAPAALAAESGDLALTTDGVKAAQSLETQASAVKIDPETLWAGCEYQGSVHFVNFPKNGKIINVKSSNPKVLKATCEGTAVYDNTLTPLKPGKSKISVTYKAGSKKKTVSAVYTVKKYPAPYKSILVNDKKINIKDNKYYYDVNSYKKTSAKVKVNPKSGWKIVDSYAFAGESFTPVKNGKAIKIRKLDNASMFFVVANKAGDRIQYGVRFYRQYD